MKNKSDQIAIVSIAGVFPGAENTDIFINNILNKKNAISDIPQDRWTLPIDTAVSKLLIPDTARCSKAGLIHNFSFDPKGYQLPSDLLSELDLTHQLVLHAGKDAIQNCYVDDDIKKRTGVILASISLPTDKASQLSYDIIVKQKKYFTPAQGLAASVVSLPAALLARCLDLYGGCYTLDAACASSLYSIKLSCDELLMGNTDMMIAGGVSRTDSLYTQIGFSQLQALSPSGLCSPFDNKADGLLVGEGVGIVVLKRLKDAIECNDKIYGVIKGFGLSNDIEGNLVAPASEGQIRALKQAYQSANWSIDQVQYIECHGSATPVGDNIELSSMIEIEKHYNSDRKPILPCSIGSVKSNIGHLLTGAGAAGMIKTLLAMQNKFLPPSLNFTHPPDSSPLNHSNFNVQTSADEWKVEDSQTTRKAGISAFGFGGINAHLLVEEFKQYNKKNFYLPLKEISKDLPIAVVGMSTITGCNDNMTQFKKILDKTIFPTPEWLETLGQESFFISQLPIEDHEFHIPPNQIKDILPNQLIMLKAAKSALEDAGITPRPLKKEKPRTDYGAALGIEFDFKATDYHLRWKTNAKAYSSPLTATRTLGALGGIIASRIAREFKFGGPCFTVSSGNNSGLKALDIGVKSLRSGETNIFVCGSIDMATDMREFLVKKNLNSSIKNDLKYFPSEGAGALVLKTLDQAKKDNSRIYGVIKGIGHASGGELKFERALNLENLKKAHQRSLKRCLGHSNAGFNDIDHYELSINTIEEEAEIENSVLEKLNSSHSNINHKITSGSVHKLIGDTGSSSGLLSLIKGMTIFNPEGKFQSSKHDKTKNICIGSITDDGGSSHVFIETLDSYLKFKEHHGKTLKTKNLLKIIPDLISKSAQDTAEAHNAFLDLTQKNMAALTDQFKALTKATSLSSNLKTPIKKTKQPLFDRNKCLEFAIGKVTNVLGEKFRIVDSYPVRVRLPAEPLMLVDRIIDIEGEMLSLNAGKIVTQHDVKPNAWYLDGGKAPVSITIEAGQADLFLSSYLGIDHKVKGIRSYRLLDARVTFHRTLPEPGETIEYHIEIDRFINQGDVYLFFFHYKGYINNQLLISMRDGCAGFFTPEEVENSGGIIFKKEDSQKELSRKTFKYPVEFSKEILNDDQIQALRNLDLEHAFGSQFKGIELSSSLKLPGGKMHLIDRVTEIDPNGGRYGLGSITAQADIKKDHWFLACHFIDDMVMPGTLMYECCSHALRIFTLRMGWVSSKIDVHYDVIDGLESDLKCRGPVTTDTKKAGYFIEIKEIGYNPEPYIIADAHMFSDDLQIVLYKDIGFKISGLNKKEIEDLWN